MLDPALPQYSLVAQDAAGDLFTVRLTTTLPPYGEDPYLLSSPKINECLLLDAVDPSIVYATSRFSLDKISLSLHNPPVTTVISFLRRKWSFQVFDYIFTWCRESLIRSDIWVCLVVFGNTEIALAYIEENHVVALMDPNIRRIGIQDYKGLELILVLSGFVISRLKGTKRRLGQEEEGKRERGRQLEMDTEKARALADEEKVAHRRMLEEDELRARKIHDAERAEAERRQQQVEQETTRLRKLYHSNSDKTEKPEKRHWFRRHS